MTNVELKLAYARTIKCYCDTYIGNSAGMLSFNIGAGMRVCKEASLLRFKFFRAQKKIDSDKKKNIDYY